MPIGFTVFQVRFTLQLLEPAEMVQADVAGVSVPVMAHTAGAVAFTALENREL
jgi:hypothetical protein